MENKNINGGAISASQTQPKNVKFNPAEILDFDILADSAPDFLQPKPKLGRPAKVRVSTITKSIVGAKIDSEVLGDSKIKAIQSPTEALTTHANTLLKTYISTIPEFRSIIEQIAECKRHIITFTKKDPDNRLEFYKEKMADLVDQQKQFTRILNSNNYYANRKQQPTVDIQQALATDTYILAFKQQEDTLKSQLQESSPYYLVEKLRAYREQINLREMHNKYVVEDFDKMFAGEDTKLDENLTDQEIAVDRVSDVMVAFTYPKEENNKVVTCSDNALIENYFVCCSHIGNIINISKEEVADISLGTIFARLKVALAEKDAKLVNDYDYVRLMIMNRKSEIYADINNEKFNISDLIYSNFSVFTQEGEKKARELLASSSIKTVKGIAYRICSKYKNLNRYEDAVSYGLYGLSVAINKYVEMQKSQPDQVINFKSLINSYVSATIKSGFVEMSSMGVASTSHIQRQHTLLNKRIANFIKYNPEYADVDNEQLRIMLRDNDDFMETIIIRTETEYTSTNVLDGRESEAWDLISSSKEKLIDYAESKSDHKLLIKSIKKMLNLFESKVGADNITFKTGKKLFDKYDARLFEMSFGFDYKRSSGDVMTNGSANYTQIEMGQELEKMYRLEGITKTFSQPAIATRLTKIYEKVRFAVANNPELKRAFEYINKVYCENHEVMNYLSNCREEEGLTLLGHAIQQARMPLTDKDLNKMAFKKISIDGCFTTNDAITAEISEMFNEEML